MGIEKGDRHMESLQVEDQGAILSGKCGLPNWKEHDMLKRIGLNLENIKEFSMPTLEITNIGEKGLL